MNEKPNASNLQDQQPMEDGVLDNNPREDGDDDVRGSFVSSMGQLPWWIISATTHGIFIFISMLIVIGGKTELAAVEIVKVDMSQPPPDPVKPPERTDISKNPQINLDKRAEQVFYTPEKLEVQERVETENEVQDAEHPARGQEDAVSTIPAEGRGAIGFFGVGSGGRSGAFGWRTGGGRKRLGMKNGGSEASESAVDLGLEWLFWHQEQEGFWDVGKYEGTMTGKNGDRGITGLALLAFLGAGHTEKHGKYKDTVKRAVAYLIREQNTTTGLWDPQGKSYMYQAGICAMALSEAAGMGQIPETQAAAQRAIDGIQAAQMDYAAFDYRPKADGAAKNDSSITIWCAMAYKSAKVSGLKVSGEATTGIMNWVDHAQDLSGAKEGDYAYTGGRIAYRGTMTEACSMSSSALLTAAVGVIRLFWNQPPTHPGIMGPCNILIKQNVPAANTPGNQIPYYYAYYATLLMFQKGGEHWQLWNSTYLQQTLLQAQCKGDPKALGGSFDVPGGRERNGGRPFTTALAVLSLEVFYRYLPMYR